MTNLEKDVTVCRVDSYQPGERTMLSNSTYLEGSHCLAYFVMDPKANSEVYDEWKAKIHEASKANTGLMVTYGPRTPKWPGIFGSPNLWCVDLSEGDTARYVKLMSMLLPSLEGIVGLEQVQVR